MTKLIALDDEEIETMRHALIVASRRYLALAEKNLAQGIMPDEISTTVVMQAAATAALLDKL